MGAKRAFEAHLAGLRDAEFDDLAVQYVEKIFGQAGIAQVETSCQQHQNPQLKSNADSEDDSGCLLVD